MAGTNIFTNKKILLDKANQSIVIIAGAAAFITVFCLVASKTLIGQASYQNRVIKAENQAYTTLTADINAETQLNSSYQAWETQNPSQNIIGGNPTGHGFNDGDNAQIILDALPPQYDFPALITNLDGLLNVVKVSNVQLSGQDQQLLYQQQTSSPNPQPVIIPFSISAAGNYATTTTLISALQNTIRPIQLLTLSITGTSSSLTSQITAQTYYQPSKTFTITQEAVK